MVAIQMCIFIHIRIYIHTYMRTYVRTYIHALHITSVPYAMYVASRVVAFFLCLSFSFSLSLYLYTSAHIHIHTDMHNMASDDKQMYESAEERLYLKHNRGFSVQYIRGRPPMVQRTEFNNHGRLLIRGRPPMVQRAEFNNHGPVPCCPGTPRLGNNLGLRRSPCRSAQQESNRPVHQPACRNSSRRCR